MSRSLKASIVLAVAWVAAGAVAGLPDTVPPAAVDDLRPNAQGPDTIELIWTSPGDDGDQGTAAVYDIRYSSAPIADVSAFNAATAVAAVPLPQQAGSPQTVQIGGLARGSILYFAIRTRDEAGNWSLLGNEASANTSFPGHGHATTGGSGSDVYHVTSLADSGPGTLRDAVYGNRSGPRTIVFDIAGVIQLQSDIRVRRSLGTDELTVDGGTAPSPGITIRKRPCQAGLTECPVGDPCLQNGEFLVGANDADATREVILSNLRFHGNYEPTWGQCLENSGATLGMQYHFRDIVLDHLTIRNGVDSAPDLWTGTWTSMNISLTHSLMAWSNHPLTISGAGGGGVRQSLTFYRNLIARSRERMPQFVGRCADVEFRNNVVFDWGQEGGSYGTRIRNFGTAGEKTDANIVGNYWVHVAPGNPRGAFFYGEGPGSESSTSNGDGGPAACTTADACAN
ncbi:MAG: hypothetical protein PVH00_13515, partial [Gemmatimonadota bacterium]